MNPRTVLITGATKGLGLEFVKQFVKRKEPPKLILAACLDPNNAKVLTKILSFCMISISIIGEILLSVVLISVLIHVYL